MDLTTVPLPVILGVSLGALMLTIFVAHLLAARGTTSRDLTVSGAEAALFGLAALMIGFTFSLALSRFEDRRDAMIAEANAIGTTGLRAQFFDPPVADEIRSLLVDYIDLRLDLARRGAAASELMVELDASSAIQLRLWDIARDRQAEDPSMVPTGIFIRSLNDMIDLQTTRLAEVQYRVPTGVLFTLYALVFGACIVSSYSVGLARVRFNSTVYLLGIASILMIYLIQDLDRPNTGILTLNQQPMESTRAMIAGRP